MKKIVLIFILNVLLVSGLKAEYIPGNQVTTSEDIVTTTSIVMHPSWDLNKDGVNDCEKEWICDDSIDYSKSRSYNTSLEFLKAEWLTCKMATDWCNSVSITDWKLGAMTKIYCEDIYWNNGKEKWSCIDDKLENDRLWFLSLNDRNDYKNLKVKLWDNKCQKLEKIVSTYWDKVLESKKYDINRSIAKVDRAILSLDNSISVLLKSYPADAPMNNKDTNKYYILKLARFELMIMKNKWEVNSGIK